MATNINKEEFFAKYPSLRGVFESDEKESHDGREERLLSWISSRDDYAHLKNNPQAILDAIDEFATQHEFLISIGPHKANVFTDILLKQKPKTCVEFGGYLGYSAILIGSVVRQYATDAHVWSFELDPKCAAVATELIQLAGLQDSVTVVIGSAIESASKLQQEGKLEVADLLLLDHVEDLYLEDFKKCKDMSFISKGSLVVADNVVRPGVPEYRAYVRSLKDVDTKGVKGLIMPGEFDDEFEVTTIL